MKYAVVLLMLASVAHARWKPEYASQPQEVRDWYANARVMPRAYQRLKAQGHDWQKCCDHADVVKTKFEVDRSSGSDVWYYEDRPGHMKRIPDDIIHWEEVAPGGKPTLFVYEGIETCFYPGEGGI